MKRPLNDREKAIISALEGGSLSTRELAEIVGDKLSAVYNLCYRLEKKEKLLTSEISNSSRRAFYFPMTREVLTRDNYKRINDEIENADNPDVHLYSFYPKARLWSLPGEPVIHPSLEGDPTTVPSTGEDKKNKP